jgi:hypothetical protein
MNIRQLLSNFFHLLGFLIIKEKKYSLKELAEILHQETNRVAHIINDLQLLEEHKTDIWKIIEQDGMPKCLIVLEEYIPGACQDIGKEMMLTFLLNVRGIHRKTNYLSPEEWIQFQNASQGYFNDLIELIELKVIHLVNDIVIEHKTLQENNERELSKYGIISHTIEE